MLFTSFRPQVFSTPAGFTVLSVIENESLKADPIDTWGVPNFVAWTDKYPGGTIAPSMVAKLLVMKLFKERPLRKEEEDMLRAVSVNGAGGTTSSIGRSRFLSLYGYLGTPAEGLLDSMWPCAENVYPTTGAAATGKSKVTSPCGQKRFCKPCEKLFAAIDQSYPTYVVSDVLLALFTKAAPTWKGQIPVEPAMWARKDDLSRSHTGEATGPGRG